MNPWQASERSSLKPDAVANWTCKPGEAKTFITLYSFCTHHARAVNAMASSCAHKSLQFLSNRFSKEY
jgi:hypothetical protein